VTIASNALTCDTEPIHIPGAIQPHGVLVALDPRTLKIIQVSANCASLFGAPPDQVLGRPLHALMVDGSGDAMLTALALNKLTRGEPLFAEVNGSTLDVRAHRHKEVAIVEFERQTEPRRRASTTDAMLRSALSRLQQPDGLHEICAVAVEEVRKLSGFDRVLLYQFDEEGHGDVIEEARADDVDAYWGHRFPASDIPRQARELYVLSWLRLIPNATYTPVTLVPEHIPANGAPLDLTFSTLRSVSPIHLEYLRNMGVQASMSVSLVRSGKLWGLIACHHRSPRHMSFAERAACEVIGRVASLQIAALEEIESRVFRHARSGFEATLVEAMRNTKEEPVQALLQRGDALLALVNASGAAICTSSGVQTVGVTPGANQIAALLSWLAREGGGNVLHTDRLSERHAPAAEYAGIASGLLALSLPGVASYVLWFRPELVHTVSWAGNPDAKQTPLGSDDAQHHPRRSFETWKEVLRGRAVAWRYEELDSAEDLRRRAIEVDLDRQIARAEQAVRDRDETVAILSHDLKTPLQVIQLASKVLRRNAAGDASATATIDRVERAVQRMSGLIHDLLDLAKIEAGRFDLTRAPCQANRLVSDVFTIVAPLAEAKNVRLRLNGEGSVDADADRVFQALSNLIGNAIKFVPLGGEVSVQIETLTSHTVRFAIADNGPGIAAVELPHIFDRYWHSRRARGGGTGLGLYIAKGIVEAHGGRLWVESVPGQGATFLFTLPAAIGELLQSARELPVPPLH
jgi:two-component system, chemotaxis family, sensor kinase Cph1